MSIAKANTAAVKHYHFQVSTELLIMLCHNAKECVAGNKIERCIVALGAALLVEHDVR